MDDNEIETLGNTDYPPPPAEESTTVGAFKPSQAPSSDAVTVDAFAEQAAYTISNPKFETLTAPEKVAELNKIYSQKKWDPEVYDTLKDLTTTVWDEAEPEDKPNFTEIAGTPPLVEKGADVSKALEDWKTDAIQKVYKEGVSPALFGKQLDDYLEGAAGAEKNAYIGRNRTAGNWFLNRAGNLVREGVKGAASLVTGTAAAIPRLAGAPFGLGQETADAIESAPEVFLGTPADDFLYNTDKDGYPTQNPDGTLQTHWQAQAAQSVGAISAAIGSLGTAAYFGAGAKALQAANISVNTLSMANSSFRQVYAQTDDLGKAYTASMLTLPAAAVASMGEFGIISGKFSPALKSMSIYDQAAFLAKSAAKNAVVGGATFGAVDLLHQGAIKFETNEPISGEQILTSAATGAFAAGVTGAPLDLARGRRAFTVNQQQRAANADSSVKEMANFRAAISQEKIISINAEDVPRDYADTMGIKVEALADGTTRLTKVADTVIAGGETVPELVQLATSLDTPAEVARVANRLTELATKKARTPEEEAELASIQARLPNITRPEHQNTIRAIEGQVAALLEQSPGDLPVRWDAGLNKWENIETGQQHDFLKDALRSKEAEISYAQDLSDVTALEIVDGDALKLESEAPQISYEEAITTAQKEHFEALALVQSNEKALKEATQNNAKLAATEAKQQKLLSQAAELQKQANLPIEPVPEAPPKTEQQAAAKLQKKLTEATADLLDKRNEYQSASKENKKRAASAVRRSIKKTRELSAALLRGKEALRKELKALKEYQKKTAQITKQKNAQERIKNQIEKLKAQAAAFPTTAKQDTLPFEKAVQEARVSVDDAKNRILAARQRVRVAKHTETSRSKKADLLTKVAAKGLGAIVHSGDRATIVLPEGLAPEVKQQVTAHEVAHAVTSKVELTPDAEQAVRSAVEDLKSRAKVSTAREVADKAFLPEVSKAVSIPENAKVSELDKKSRDALFSEREFLANQIGALMLERAGSPVAGYEILPEVRASLDNTKLPAVEKISAPKGQETVAVEETASAQAITEEPRNAPEKETIDLNPYTGKKKETAFSQSVTEKVTNHPPTLYDEMSRVKGGEEATKFVAEKGAAKTREILESPDVYQVSPEQRVLLTDALLAKAKEEFNLNSTPTTRENLYLATQMRAQVATSAGQQLALLQRFRGTESFADFIVTIDKAYKEAGHEAPTFTEYQLKELELAYEQAAALPEGTLQNNYVMKLYSDILAKQKISWPQFLQSYIRSNLLSGVGTEVINTVGGAWMGPVLTALAHPVQGRGLVWRAMHSVLPVALGNAKLVIEGKAGDNLLGGLIDPSPLRIKDTSTVPRAIASFYNKFGRAVWKGLGAMDGFMRTLSAEGYMASKKYADLKQKYGNDPARLAAETGKIIISRDQYKAALIQANKEGKALGLELTPGDKASRAYELIRKQDTSDALIEEAADWADITSLRGKFANPVQHLLHKMFYSQHIWEQHPVLGGVRNLVAPFGRALLAISDFGTDLIPGNILFDKAGRYVSNKAGATIEPRTPAARERLMRGQIIGTALAATALGLVRSGAVRLTGEEEQVLDRGGGGESKGKPAVSRAQFKEFAQLGDPAYSIIFPDGSAVSYKDIPGLNAIMLGIHKANKQFDAGKALPYVAMEFFRNAYVAALPVVGIGSLNSPYTKLINTIIDPETTGSKIQQSFEQVATQTVKMLTPASSLLRDVKTVYDETPEETNQALTVQMFKDVPGVSELLGSKPALNRFGEPIVKSALERVPGVGRIIEEQKIPTDLVARKLIEKGIIVPELARNIKFNKSDFPSSAFQQQYNLTREEAVGKAYANAFTPDEWYAFIKATGPHIKRIAEQLADSALPTDRAQQELLKRTRAIEDQAKKRFIRTGSF